MEARAGKLISTEFQVALLNKELLQQLFLEPAVEMALSRQLHVALAFPAAAETLTIAVANLARTDNGFDPCATLMT